MPIASTAADDVRRQVCRLESPRRVSFRSEQERAVLQSLEDELRVQLLPRLSFNSHLNWAVLQSLEDELRVQLLPRASFTNQQE